MVGMLLAAAGEGWIFAQQPAVPSQLVPFVGCASDGQVGPTQPPEGQSIPVRIAAEAAPKLAYYKSAQGIGVLAPRQWHCFGIYGSGSATLFVSPQPINAVNLLSGGFRGLSGPAVAVRHVYGDTSGRFLVAQIIARVFPKHRKFVTEVMDSFDIPPGSFPSRPYPDDRLTYRSDNALEYRTSSQADGLGLHSGLMKDNDPIQGVAILFGQPPDLLLLSVRLPSDLRNLTIPIIQQFADEAERRQEERP